MCVHDRLNIRPHAIDQQMHPDFAGNAAPSRYLLAVQVHDDHVGRPHRSFANARWGHQNAVARQAHRQISVHSRHEPPFVEHTSVADDFFPMFTFRQHGYPWGEMTKSRPHFWHPHSSSTHLAETILISRKIQHTRSEEHTS